MDRCVIFLLLAVIAPLSAQFSELATTDDGTRLYFSSTLTLTTAVGHPESRIFQVTGPNAIAIFAERGSLAPISSFGSGDGARRPRVSGSGSLVAFTLSGICHPQPPCQSPVTRTVLRGAAAEASFDAESVFLSRNGRYLLETRPPGPPPANTTAPSLLRDLQTGETREVPPSPMIITSPLASDATVVIQQSTGVALWKNGVVTPVPLQGPYAVWGISDNARVLLYFQLDLGANPIHRLVSRNLLTGEDTVILSRPALPGPINVLGLSNDGSRVFFRSTDDFNAGTAWISSTSNVQLVPIALAAGELASEGTLSGDGRWAFAATTEGRLVKIDAASGSIIDTVVPQTPYLISPSMAAPGSFMRLNGAGLKNARVLLDGSPVPVLRTTSTSLDFQIPWETLSSSTVGLQLDSSTQSPFHQSHSVSMAAMAPRFEFRPIRPDFSGYFNPGPGDDFILYATGLGAVDGLPITGEPTPTDRLYRITGDFRCRFFPYSNDAEILFAGLAPGYTGIYQLNFRLPKEAVTGPITGGVCHYGTDGAGGSIGFAILGTP